MRNSIEISNETLIEINKAIEYLNVSYWRQFRPIFYCFDLFIFYSNFLDRNNIA